MPASLLSAAFLVALIPGYLFLTLTEGFRKPRQSTSLGELLEMVAVGVATSGVAILLASVTHGEWLQDATALGTPGEIRTAMLVIAGLAGAAIAISTVAAFLVRKVKARAWLPSVWAHHFAGVTDEAPLLVLMLLNDGSQVSGYLAGYDTHREGLPRDLSLKSPVTFERPTGESVTLPVSQLIVPETIVRMIGLIADAPMRLAVGHRGR